MNNLLDMTAGSLQRKLRAWGEPDYRARQIWCAIYQQQVGSFQAATSLPDSLRKRLTVEFS
ncbi:MAG TPA: 23S rRNA (adenine(2503)-C2)-methyltransferase, partial [Anaerolineales bacterium]|nr:23S rRNA (adenine(2503)-C2)-methyltransferase [Anaerolineales bacterium]